MSKRNKRFFTFLLVLYILAMLWLLLGQRITPGTSIGFTAPTEDRINLEPFATVKLYMDVLKYSKDRGLLIHSIINLVGNVVMFIPLGYLLPRLFRPMRCFLLLSVSTVVSIVLIEVLQLYTGLGSCDVDDLILNVIGVSIGYLLNLIWRIRTK